MNLRPLTSALALSLSLWLTACGGASEGDSHEAEGGHGGHAEAEEVNKGEHGGRLLEKNGVTVELGIAEDGTPPKFQAWLYRDGKPLPPSAGRVEVRLDIVPDEYEPFAHLSAFDEYGEEIARVRVRPDFKLNARTAGAWVDDEYRRPGG